MADARVEAEVADELVRGGEAAEVADGGADRERDGRIDASDRHQPLHLLACKRDASEISVDQQQLLGVEVELTQKRLDGATLIER